MKLKTSLSTHPGVAVFPQTIVNEAGDLAHLPVFIDGESLSQEAVDVVTDIRERYVPEAFAGVAAEVLVGGITAEVADTFSIVDR